MPDDSKNKFLVLVGDISSSDTDELHTTLFTSFKSLVVVGVLVEDLLWRFVDLLPVDGSWLNLVNDLAEENTI